MRDFTADGFLGGVYQRKQIDWRVTIRAILSYIGAAVLVSMFTVVILAMLYVKPAIELVNVLVGGLK